MECDYLSNTVETNTLLVQTNTWNTHWFKQTHACMSSIASVLLHNHDFKSKVMITDAGREGGTKDKRKHLDQ
jgi:hypothetical protein